MKVKTKLLLISVSVGLWATGCSTPVQVKNLARETQRATDHMANVHERDLLALAAYDEGRVAQFNRFLGDYFALRDDVARAFNDVLNRSKAAVLDELDHQFDQRAEQLLTVDFWIAFREEADKELTDLLRKDKERAAAATAASFSHPTDAESIRRSLLETRKVYANAAQRYDAVEKSYAELARNIHNARNAYRLENEKRLEAIQPLKPKEEAKSFSLPSNAEEIARRVNELRPAYQTLNKAQAALSRYLDEYNPTADFLEGVVSGLTGSALQVSESAGTNSVRSVPAEPGKGGLPGLGELFSSMQNIAASIAGKRTEGLAALTPAIQKLLSDFRPVIKGVAATP